MTWLLKLNKHYISNYMSSSKTLTMCNVTYTHYESCLKWWWSGDSGKRSNGVDIYDSNIIFIKSGIVKNIIMQYNVLKLNIFSYLVASDLNIKVKCKQNLIRWIYFDMNIKFTLCLKNKTMNKLYCVYIEMHPKIFV